MEAGVWTDRPLPRKAVRGLPVVGYREKYEPSLQRWKAPVGVT